MGAPLPSVAGLAPLKPPPLVPLLLPLPLRASLALPGAAFASRSAADDESAAQAAREAATTPNSANDSDDKIRFIVTLHPADLALAKRSWCSGRAWRESA